MPRQTAVKSHVQRWRRRPVAHHAGDIEGVARESTTGGLREALGVIGNAVGIHIPLAGVIKTIAVDVSDPADGSANIVEGIGSDAVQHKAINAIKGGSIGTAVEGIRQRLDAHGLVIAEIEVVRGWANSGDLAEQGEVLERLAAVLGGTQSLHTNSKDEALSLPSQESALTALRTQQIIAEESGGSNTVDPLGGSFFIENQTDRIEAQAYEYFRRIDDLGGVLPAIDKGFFQGEISDASYRYQREIDGDVRRIVGVNAYQDQEPYQIPILRMDPQGYKRQVDRLENLRLERDNGRVGQVLDRLRLASQGTENTMPFILEAVRAYATLGEIVSVLKEEFGIYQEPTWI